MSEQPNVAEFVSKRIDRFNRFESLCKIMAEDLKEMKYQVTQYEAKVQTYEKQIMLRKAEITELDEVIRRRKIEAAGSLANVAGDVQRREIDLVRRMAELEVRERNVKLRAAETENLLVKAEKILGHKSAAPIAIKTEPDSEVAPEVAREIEVPAVTTEQQKAPVVSEVKRGRGRPKKEVAVSA